MSRRVVPSAIVYDAAQHDVERLGALVKYLASIIVVVSQSDQV